MIEQLRRIVGEAGLLLSEADMAPFLEDWRGRYRGQALCVVLPASTEELASVMKLCAAANVPVVPQGGNTSLCGGSVPPGEGSTPVVVGLRRLRRIRAIDPANDAITVDAGCVLADVQAAAAGHDRLYAVSLGAEGSCQVGGTIATNAGGTGVLRYGTTRDNVLGLEVVLADGTIWNGLNALRKNNTGYDLKHLFIGAEGTLGIITGAVLKLHPLPTARSVAWLAVADPRAAGEVLGLFRRSCGSQLSAFELMNDLQVRLVVEHVPGRRKPVDGESWHVLVELSDTGNEALLETSMQSVLEQAFSRDLVADAVIGASEAQRDAMWAFRHSVSEANKKGGVGLTSDTVVPVSAVPDFIAAATAGVRAIVPDLPVVIVSHLGDGNVHFIPFFGFAEWDALPDPAATEARVRRAVDDAAAALGGTFSAEHGVGVTHLPDMARYKASSELAMMRAIKRSLDPGDLLNPGRLLPPEAAPGAFRSPAVPSTTTGNQERVT